MLVSAAFSMELALSACLGFVAQLLLTHPPTCLSLAFVQPLATHALHIDTSGGSESAHVSSSAHPDASLSPSPLPAASSPSAGDDDAELVKIQKQQQQHDEQLSLQSPDGFNVNGGFDFRGEQV